MFSKVTLVAMIAAVAAMAPAAQAVPGSAPWQARHDLSAGQYQAAFNQFTKQGLRLVSVNGYLKNNQLKYAALWRKIDGPAWTARHGLSSSQYQKAFNDNAKAGNRLVYVSGYALANGSVRYAAIWEKRTGPALVARHGLTASQFQSQFGQLTKSGHRLLHVSGYNAGGSVRFAAIFEKSSGPAWVARHGLSAKAYQARFDEYLAQGFRLKTVSGYNVGGKDRYAAIWEKVSSPVWRARHHVPGASYQRAFDIDRYKGYAPVYVNGFTSGDRGRFNTIWESPFKPDDFSKLEAAGTNFLKTATEPQTGLSVAIAKEGRLVWASGYGLADRALKIPLDVNHKLRIGSISKSITAVALYRMLGRAGLSRPVFGPGGILSDVAIPPSMKALEGKPLQMFLNHTSGIPGAGPRNNDPDGNGPMARPFLIPDDAVDCGPDGKRPLAERIAVELDDHADDSAAAGRPALNGNPGDYDDYSNFSHTIAEAVIERLSKPSYASYAAYVKARVFQPAGVFAAELFKIGDYKPASGEAQHYTPGGDYAIYPSNATCEEEPPGVGAGGWAMSAKDLLRVFVHVDGRPERELLSKEDWAHSTAPSQPKIGSSSYASSWITGNWGWCGTGAVTTAFGHNGGLSGAYSNMFLLPNGYSFVVMGNQNIRQNGACHDGVKPFYDLLTQIDWPEYDLF